MNEVFVDVDDGLALRVETCRQTTNGATRHLVTKGANLPGNPKGNSHDEDPDGRRRSEP